MGGSAFVVLLVFETIANLNSLETRETVETFLAEPPGAGLGLSVDGALTVMRTLSMVAAGCATAAGILGFQVLRRNRTARIALTVLAVPLLISGMVTGGFLSSLVAAAAFLLWLPPARDWFSDRPARGPAGGAQHAAFATPPTPAREPSPPATGPHPMVGFGSRTSAEPGAPVHQERGPRPPAVLWACVLTWCFSAFGAALMIVGLVYLAVASDTLVTDLREQNPELADAGLTDEMLVVATYVTGIAFVVWALAAMVLAVLFYRGVSWSRLVLMISTGGALALLALGTLSQFVFMVPLMGAAATMTLLLRPEAAAWVKR